MVWFKQRVKVRNCIRKYTYRYFLIDDQAPMILSQLIKSLGNPHYLEAFGLFQFEAPQFTMRIFKNEAILTVIYKNESIDFDERLIESYIEE